MSLCASHNNVLPLHVSSTVRTTNNSEECLAFTEAPMRKGPYVSRWCYVEYGLYSLYLLGSLCYSWSTVASASFRSVKNLSLEPVKWSWISNLPFTTFGYDMMDRQWRHFDRSLRLLFLFLSLIVFGSRCIRLYFKNKQNGDIRCARALHLYHASTGLAYVAFLHGSAFVIPVMITVCNFFCVNLCVKHRVTYVPFMVMMWIIQLSLLFTIMYSDGFQDNSAVAYISTFWKRQIRWRVMFNLYTLRMIAFNMDFYWASNDGPAQQERALRKHNTTCVDCALMREDDAGATDSFNFNFNFNSNASACAACARCYKFRTEFPRPLPEYSLLSYMAYMFYTPLYISGPMSSFNAFVSHSQTATRAVPVRQKVLYALRIVAIYFVIVVMLHYLYVNAFRAEPSVFFSLTMSEQVYIFYYSLAFLWLKFSFMWKFARLAALLDGIDVPEDMRRCFSNTLSVRDFWRDWHASFNLWIVRYMYIPMGGSKKKHLNILPIFLFIAIWHDISLILIRWAFCVVVIFALEMLISSLWNSRRFVVFRCSRYERFVRSLGGLFTVFGLIAANIIGFSHRNSPRNNGTAAAGGFHSDYGIIDTFKSVGFQFCLGGTVFLYCVAATAIFNRDAEAARDAALKKRLGLVY